ncbi:MAG: aminotransferase class I/II-fold pyridoxal phosphate-dependent enzyme, partial [Nanoarchaeota archaeon]|nr:aminotransferase class I/II-fold pyridoxal phosphate-dependent enzyme [Nanoarchaeota archaeon]
MNPQAEELNTILKKHPSLFEMFSENGKEIYFPKKGILGQTAEAKGKRINATIGSAIRDEGGPMCLASIHKLVQLPAQDVFTYAPSYGRKDLRESWQKLILSKNPSLKTCISLPVVAAGLTHGLSMAGYLFLNPGDEILMPDKYWGNYTLIFTNAYGGKIATFPLFSSDGFNINGLRETLSRPGEKKVVLLNFPNNPTGYTPTQQEMREIVAVLKEAAQTKKVVVILDDAYFGLVYEKGVETESPFAWLADCHENLLAVKIDGGTKEDYTWGFRIAFMTYGMKGMTPEMLTALEDKTAGAIRGNLSNASHVSQSLLLEGYKSPTYAQEKHEAHATLKRRYDAVKRVLAGKNYEDTFSPLPFNSGYCLSVQLKNADPEKVRKRLLEAYATGVNKDGNLIRVSFAAVKES